LLTPGAQSVLHLPNLQCNPLESGRLLHLRQLHRSHLGHLTGRVTLRDQKGGSTSTSSIIICQQYLVVFYQCVISFYRYIVLIYFVSMSSLLLKCHKCSINTVYIVHSLSVCNNTSSIFCEIFIDKLTIPGTSKIPSNSQWYISNTQQCFIYASLIFIVLCHYITTLLPYIRNNSHKKTPVTPHVYLFYNSSIIQQYMSFVSSLSISFNTLQQHFINSTPMFHQCLFVSSVYHKHYIKLSPMFHHFVNTSSVRSKTFYLSTWQHMIYTFVAKPDPAWHGVV